MSSPYLMFPETAAVGGTKGPAGSTSSASSAAMPTPVSGSTALAREGRPLCVRDHRGCGMAAWRWGVAGALYLDQRKLARAALCHRGCPPVACHHIGIAGQAGRRVAGIERVEPGAGGQLHASLQHRVVDRCRGEAGATVIEEPNHIATHDAAASGIGGVQPGDLPALDLLLEARAAEVQLAVQSPCWLVRDEL